MPSSVKLAWLNCPVRPYIPNPLRCFNCQRFGHSKQSCRSKPVCARCSGPDHSDNTCELQPLCINCKGAHAAYSRSCPRWSQEKEIQSTKVLQNVSFDEARKIVTARTPRPGVSYSAAAKTSFCSTGTQTDIPLTPILQNTKQKSIFNFTVPSSHKSTSPPPSKTSRTALSVKPRPALKQRPNLTPPSLKPGLTHKKKNRKVNQYTNQSASVILQRMDDEVTLHPSDDELIFEEQIDEVPASTSKLKT